MGTEEPLDPATIDYFDSSVPEYGVERLSMPAAFISAHMHPGASLIDVGAGTGNTLEYLKAETGLSNLAALDVSGECLRVLRTRVECETHHGSILDSKLVSGIGARFDFVVIAAVLHHLIGRSRRQSHEYATLAVEHSKQLLKPGGHLIVVEPVFSPRIAMSAVFYLKKAVTRVTNGRVGILSYANNIGAPVVSYYTADQLHQLLQAGAPATLVESGNDPERMGPILDHVLDRDNLTLVLRKDA